MTTKQKIIMILTAIVAAATAILQLLSSCKSSTEFIRKTPVDSVYYKSDRELYKVYSINPNEQIVCLDDTCQK